jgi:hypothetical protein
MKHEEQNNLEESGCDLCEAVTMHSTERTEGNPGMPQVTERLPADIQTEYTTKTKMARQH